MDLYAFIESIPRPLSHFIFGALGGLLYLLRQMVKGYAVKLPEFAARPVFGAVSAYVITIVLGLPNHFTSLFVGYFGIDVFDAVASRFDVKALSFSKHAKPEPKPAKPSDEDEHEPDLPL